MKKRLALLLAVLMLLPLGTACHDETVPNPSETDEVVAYTDITLTDYTIVRPELASSSVISCGTRMKVGLDEKINAQMPLETDWLKRGTEPDPAAREILIGLTNRSESIELYNQLEGIGYAVALRGNKIVIVANHDEALMNGINYFLDTYVRSGSAVAQIPETLSYFSEPQAAIDVIKDGKALYTVVRAENADTYMVEQAQSVRTALQSATGVAPDLGTDWVKRNTEPDSSLHEILVGETNRPETAQVKAELGANEYAVKAVGNKIVLIGASTAGTGKAVSAFSSLVSGSAGQKVDGKAALSLLADTDRRGSIDEWITDVPAFAGGVLHGALDCNDNTYEAYYTDTTKDAFDTYCKTLEDSGYTLYVENEITGNLFRTYTKEKKQIVHVYYVDYLHAVRLIVSPYENGLPPLTVATGEKVTEPSITQMILDYETGTFGMCYIITLEDGSFIIFDGGGNSSTYDAERLYTTLKSLNRRQGKPVIAAWFLTHVHWDHHSNFARFAATYGSEFTLEYAIHNAPAESYATSDGFDQFYNKNYRTVISHFGGDPQIIKLHTGMKINLHGAEFEALYSHEDCYPNDLKYFNNSTLVTRMTLGGQSVMWLGDVQNEGAGVISSMYGDYVKSDMVQVAHHGVSNGASNQLYSLIDASVALWPCKQSAFNSYSVSHSPAGYLFSTLHVKENIVADYQNTTLVLPYTPKAK